MADEEKAKELTTELICGKCTEIKHCKIIGTDKCVTYIRSLNAILQGYKKGLAEGRKEKELSYEVEEVTKVELNKCNTIEDKMEWLGKVLGQAIFKNDMNYAVWVNVQKNNIIEHLEKENKELKEQLQNNPYVQILQKEKSEMAEDFAKQIEKMKNNYKKQRNRRIDELQKENAELKEQIEKMENCWNCKFFKEKKYQACKDYKKNNTKCCAFYKWELAK